VKATAFNFNIMPFEDTVDSQCCYDHMQLDHS